jgi:hypothetical protein
MDVLLVDAVLGPLRRLTPRTSSAKWAVRLAIRTEITNRRLGGLAGQSARQARVEALSCETATASSPTPRSSGTWPTWTPFTPTSKEPEEDWIVGKGITGVGVFT